EGAGPLLVHLPVPAEPPLGAAVRLQGDATESSHGAGELQAGAEYQRGVVGGSHSGSHSSIPELAREVTECPAKAPIPTSAGRFSGWGPAGQRRGAVEGPAEMGPAIPVPEGRS